MRGDGGNADGQSGRSVRRRQAGCRRERAIWANVGLSFEFSSYLTDEPPPLAFVTSVRAILECEGQVLVFDDDHGSHVIPGGHRESGESLIETLRREILEETGCEVVGQPRQLGVLQFHLLSPRPQGSPYPYPDSFHLIYAATARRSRELVSQDVWVQRPRFIQPDAALVMDMPLTERAFLRAALGRS